MDEMEKQFGSFVDVIRKLRSEDGCPWDREQTHESLRTCLIEEAYEVADGIDIYAKNQDYKNLCEELGDLLLQIVMHGVIAEEEGIFTIQQIIEGIEEKMIHRHPHVFGDVRVENSSEVLQNWEEIKQKEKNEESISDGMERIARALPATIRAEKVQKKAANAGANYSDYNSAEKLIYDQLKTLKKSRENGDLAQIQEDYGQLLFDVVNLSRFLQLNVENSLTNVTDKFINRFVSVEKRAIQCNQPLNGMSIDELDALWGRKNNQS